MDGVNFPAGQTKAAAARVIITIIVDRMAGQGSQRRKSKRGSKSPEPQKVAATQEELEHPLEVKSRPDKPCVFSQYRIRLAVMQVETAGSIGYGTPYSRRRAVSRTIEVS